MRECLSGELIQKHIDGENSAQEDAQIIKHLADCPACVEKLESMKKSAIRVKQAVASMDESDIEIPAFKKPAAPKSILRHNIKKVVYAAVAACIIVLLTFISQKEEKKVELVFSFDLERGFNANLPVSEQEMVIQIIDSEGNIAEY